MQSLAERLVTDEQYQERALPGVSRTFALTIPQLPPPLSRVVINGYLLCRLADTIEDDARLSAEEKDRYHARFVAVVEGNESAAPLARELAADLSPECPAAERDLVGNTEQGEYYYRVKVDNAGGLIMPLEIEVTYDDGTKERKSFPVDIWRNNELTFTAGFFGDKTVVQIVVDPDEAYADIDRSNNVWTRPIT